MIEFSSFALWPLGQKFKYGLGTRFFITKEPENGPCCFKHDVEQIGLSSNAYNNTGVVSSFLEEILLTNFFNTEYRFSQEISFTV